MTQVAQRPGNTYLAPLAISQLFTGTASWSLLIGILGYATYQLRAEPLQAGLLGLAWGLPAVFLGPLAGRLIDGRGPKPVALVSGAFSIAISLCLALAPGWELLLALVLLAGVGRAFMQPAIDAMPTWLARQPDERVASLWLGFATNVPVVLGPVVAAGTLSAGGMTAMFLVNASLHVLSLLIVGPLPARTRPAGDDGPAGAAGTWWLPRSPRTRAILVISLLVWLSYGCYSVLEILYVRDVLDSPVETFTVLQMIFGTGLLVTNLVLLRFPDALTSYRILLASVVFIGLAEIVYVGSSSVVVSAIGSLCWGLGAAVFGPACRASLLVSVPPDQHGAIMALWRSVQSAGSVVPPLLVGVAGQALGTQLTMIVTSVVVVLAGSVPALSRGRRP
ncbi:MFS transporter [Actinoplanes oblitus]|uniref:MFS transporter n=1 Tax=Actinoplanes oblitus TaxID=3040509 RepID=A0ABY8WU16_9ACTN|nr:MFS transporter [Actinoplanes oblitus]WIM99839.1 MFS transporter [Actinoplanes oblitus]